MPIYDLSYRHWDGQLKPYTSMRWWVITKAELKCLAQRKFVRFIVAIPPAIYILVHGVFIYGADRLINETRFPIQINAEFFNQFLLRQPAPSGLFIGLLGVFGGAGLIANDLKHNALPIYLSKPISWKDYLIGKLAVMFILLSLITLIPGLLLFAEHLLLVDDFMFGVSSRLSTDLDNGTVPENLRRLFERKEISLSDNVTVSVKKKARKWVITDEVTGSSFIVKRQKDQLNIHNIPFIRENYWLIGSIILYSLVLIIPSSLLIVTVSSLTSNARYAAIGFAAILLGTPLIYEIIREITHSSKMATISIWANYDMLGSKLFGLSPGYASHWLWSLLTLVGLMGVCLWILYRRIKAVQIVK